jgi:hypothetical protein
MLVLALKNMELIRTDRFQINDLAGATDTQTQTWLNLPVLLMPASATSIVFVFDRERDTCKQMNPAS